MNTTVRSYRHDTDYERINRFLLKTYGKSGSHTNWLQTRWEGMFHHPLTERVESSTFGLWETGGEILALVHPEFFWGEVYAQLATEDIALKRDVLAYAEDHLAACSQGAKALRVHINDLDEEFQHVAADSGYQKGESYEEMSRLALPALFPEVPLPHGFRLLSLEERNDLSGLARVLYRGGNRGDEPPDDGITQCAVIQSAPGFRSALNIVVEAPDGSLASYCSVLYEPAHALADVRFVCVDPDYAGLGLDRAVVLEAIRRCGEQGARAAYAASAQEPFSFLGFQKLYRLSKWERNWMARPAVERADSPSNTSPSISRNNFTRSRLRSYKKSSDFSYATGVFTTLELVTARPDDALGVVLSSVATRNTGGEQLKDLCERHGIPIVISDRTLRRIAPKASHLAAGAFGKYCCQIARHRNHVVLVNPRDMGNVGTILRTMAGFGITDLAMVRPAVDIFDPKTIRASMGAVFRVAFQYFDSFGDYSRAFGHNMYPLMTTGRATIGATRFRSPFALVFGNESQGLPEEFEGIGTSVSIPQTNQVDSLNLSVAVAIALYESTRFDAPQKNALPCSAAR